MQPKRDYASTDYTVRRSTVRSTSLVGLNLGDLRKLIELTEQYDDDAMVRFEDLSQSCIYVGEWHAERVHVVEEKLIAKETE